MMYDDVRLFFTSWNHIPASWCLFVHFNIQRKHLRPNIRCEKSWLNTPRANLIICDFCFYIIIEIIYPSYISFVFFFTVPHIARAKVWKCCEVNHLIFVWYHSESAQPDWQPQPHTYISNGSWRYQGRNEFLINCHIQVCRIFNSLMR